jgi:ketosteroid isomerase-like protein
MRRMPRLASLVILGGCSGAAATAPTPHRAPPAASAELSPALAPLAWWLGDWDAADGNGAEHWVAAGGAIYGVSLHRGTFEVMIVDDGDGPTSDGVLRFYAMPDGARSVEFRQQAVAERAATFANEAHDFPKTIGYRIEGDGLVAVLGGGGKEERFAFKRGTAHPAPALEDADRVFAADTGKRGVEGWVAAFDAGGGMVRRGARVERAGIAEVMQPLLSSGRLDWAPIASGADGDLGFTVGKATFTGAKPEDGWRSTYVTIWRRQADGSWKVLFDTGRPVQD